MSNPNVKVGMILVAIVLFKSNGNHREAWANGTASRVSNCPRDEREWQKASERLNCSGDAHSSVNKYHCLPADNLTTLLELCYSRTRAQVVKGLCMVFIEKKHIVNHYECKMFKEGCPNTWYYSDEMYKFPACSEINPNQHCYKFEVSCQQSTRLLTDVLNTSAFVNETSRVSPKDKVYEITDPLIIVLSVLFLMGLTITFIVWKMRRRIKRYQNSGNIQTDEGCSFLNTRHFENFEESVSKLGIDYLLQPMPRDQEKLTIIAKKLNIPQEIINWSLENRHKFVESMKIGNISVYIGRVMVIGCARAGKTTLVKKLKGERNLKTVSTSGIEVHSHLFKLHENESTITVCALREKNKGCLCLTPTTLQLSVENKMETFSSVKVEEMLDQSNTVALRKQPYEDSYTRPSSSESSVKLNINETNDIIYQQEKLKQPKHDTATKDMLQEDEKSNKNLDQTIDLNDCMASVNMNNLKMLSLLDFAGHSAYYACHHIFFSPRAFFILVVDMTKKLDNVATEACRENDLIYSNWTYADYIRYWLGSIHTYSSKEAPVILILSHAENNGADPKKALEYYYKLCSCLPKELLTHVDKKRLFSLQKNSTKNMEDLKKCIASTMKSQNHWGEIVPISWTKLESVLRKLQEYSKIYFFPNLLRDVQNATDVSIKNEEELVTALTFFHETGVILFRTEIKDTIILDVQWFVDAFKCIILEEKHMDMKDKCNLVDFEELNEHGLLSNELLTKLWKNTNFCQHKKSLIHHMEQLNMIAHLSEKMWYVPCMNKQKYPCKILESCNVSSTLCFLFEFLPFVIYHRLVVSCINHLGMKPWKSAERMCIFHTVTILCCRNRTHRLLIVICENKERTHREYPYSIEIQINVTKPRQIDTQLTSKLKTSIRKILVDLTQAFPFFKRLFPVGYRCLMKPFSGKPEGHIIKEEDMPASEFDCSKCKQAHVVDVKSIVHFWQDDAKSKAFAIRRADQDFHGQYSKGPTRETKRRSQRLQGVP